MGRYFAAFAAAAAAIILDIYYQSINILIKGVSPLIIIVFNFLDMPARVSPILC